MNDSSLQIPEITDEKLSQLFAQIKPLVRDENTDARLIEDVDLCNIAYTWDATFKGGPVSGLTPIGEFRCLHRYGFYGLFKPSIAEVLCQIPEELVPQAAYFEIVKSPNDGDDLAAESDALNAGLHVSLVRVYKNERTATN